MGEVIDLQKRRVRKQNPGALVLSLAELLRMPQSRAKLQGCKPMKPSPLEPAND